MRGPTQGKAGAILAALIIAIGGLIQLHRVWQEHPGEYFTFYMGTTAITIFPAAIAWWAELQEHRERPLHNESE